MKFKIATKLLVSFMVITALIVIVSVIGLTGMNSTKISYEAIINESLPVENLVLEVQTVTLEQVADVRGFMVYKDEKYPALFNELTKRADGIYAQIEEKINTDESRAFLKNLRAAHNKYIEGCLVVMDYVRKGDMNNAISYGDEVKKSLTDINEITSQWNTYLKELDLGRIEKSDRDINTKIIILLVLVITAIAGAIIIGIVLARNIARPINALTIVSERISEGDLTQQVPVIKSRDEIRELGNAFSIMVENLRKLIINVNDASQELVASSEELAASSQEVSKASEQIAVAVTELARGAYEQAVSSEKGNEKISLALAGLSKIAEDMSESEKMMIKTNQVVKSGEESVRYQEQKVTENSKTTQEVAAAITDLSEKSQKIGQILEVIRGIAEQTNLLALNAAIEAARAGEEGKGFSVVADEIRKLAEQSRNSVKEIDIIIKQVQEGVETAVTKMDVSKQLAEEQVITLGNTVVAFDNIAKEINGVSNKILVVSEATSILGKNAAQVGDAMTGIARVANQTAASTQEVAASTEEQSSTVNQITDAAEDLSHLAVQLQESISNFKL